MLKLSQETALGLFHLEHLRLVRSRTANVKCLVAWSNETLLVAFRGTANLTNMLADVKVTSNMCVHCMSRCRLLMVCRCQQPAASRHQLPSATLYLHSSRTSSVLFQSV